MKINNENLLAKTGCRFDNCDELVSYVVRTLEYFDYHNKNLTKEQYHRIMLVKDILKEVQESE